MKMTAENKKFFRTIFGNFSQKWKKKFIENTIKEKYPKAKITLTLHHMEHCKKYILDLDVVVDGEAFHINFEDIPCSKTVDDVYTLMCGVVIGVEFSKLADDF